MTLPRRWTATETWLARKRRHCEIQQGMAGRYSEPQMAMALVNVVDRGPRSPQADEGTGEERQSQARLRSGQTTWAAASSCHDHAHDRAKADQRWVQVRS